VAREVHRQAVGNLDYRPDMTTTARPDDWRSHAWFILADPRHRYRDDCDGCAITAAELALAAGVPPEHVRIVMVDTKRRGDPQLIDHMVCALGVNGDDPLIIDNCQPAGPVLASTLPYTWGAGMRAAEPGVWRTTIMD
jgi:predicted transglutaminase-like cysteine proteinase